MPSIARGPRTTPDAPRTTTDDGHRKPPNREHPTTVTLPPAPFMSIFPCKSSNKKTESLAVATHGAIDRGPRTVPSIAVPGLSRLSPSHRPLLLLVVVVVVVVVVVGGVVVVFPVCTGLRLAEAILSLTTPKLRYRERERKRGTSNNKNNNNSEGLFYFNLKGVQRLGLAGSRAPKSILPLGWRR